MSLEKAKKHYIELITGSKIKIEIPEWELTVYMRPVQNLSVSTMSKIGKSIGKDSAEGAAEVLNYLATTSPEDKNDKLAFGGSAGLYDLMHNVSVEVLMKAYVDWTIASGELASENSKEIKKE